MTTPKIPKGWRKLRRGTRIQKGDRYYNGRRWLKVAASIGYLVGMLSFAYIRRIKKART